MNRRVFNSWEGCGRDDNVLRTFTHYKIKIAKALSKEKESWEG